jgi:SAM-dependent methyltransferase
MSAPDDMMSEQELSEYWDERAARAEGLGVDSAARAGTVTNEPEIVSLRDRLELAHAERLWVLSRMTRVLDLAAGAGRVALHVAPRVKHVTLIDLSDRQLALAARRAAELGLSNLKFVQRSISEGGFGGPFDLITLFGACVYLSDEQVGRLVEHCHAALAPGGKLLLKEPVSTTGETVRQELSQTGASYRATFRERDYYVHAFAPRFVCRYHNATCAHLIPWFMGGTEQAVPAAQSLLGSRLKKPMVSAYVRLDPLLLRVERWLRARRLLGRVLAQVPVLQDFYLFERKG